VRSHLAALELLRAHADKHDVVRVCCISCGKTAQLSTCSKCLTAKFCGQECLRRLWPVHKQSCKAWQADGGASSSALEEEAVDLASLLTKELKGWLDRLKISYAGVLERFELVALLVEN